MNTLLVNRTGQLAKTSTQVDYLLMDASSSMNDKWWDGLEALQSYADTLKAGNVNSRMILASFSAPSFGPMEYMVHRDESLGQWSHLVDNPIGMMGGGTPLYDAINKLAREMRDLDPPRAAITIFTDGDESDSKYTDLNQAKAILDWCRAKGWQVTFIGCDFNNSKVASMLGADASTAIGVMKALLPDAAKALGKKRVRYGLYGEPMHFNEDEHQQFGGYLTDGSK